MSAGRLFGIVLVACTLCAAGGTSALTGSGDSSLFSLNTSWVSEVENLPDLPAVDRLGDCFPNPFNPVTKISFELASPTVVDLKIYDLQGRLVRTLITGEMVVTGKHETEWNGRDERGGKVATGVYLYRLVTDRFSGSRRMTLIK